MQHRTETQAAQIAYCRRLFIEGHLAEYMIALGYQKSMIDAARASE